MTVNDSHVKKNPREEMCNNYRGNYAARLFFYHEIISLSRAWRDISQGFNKMCALDGRSTKYLNYVYSKIH